MENLLKVSVLLVVHNGEKNIEKTVLSVLNQTYQNFELIICANGCTDNTIPIIGKVMNDYSSNYKIHLTTLPAFNNSEALNWILRLATGDLVAIHDSEIWPPDKLKQEIRQFDKYPGNGGLIRFADEKKARTAKIFDMSPVCIETTC